MSRRVLAPSDLAGRSGRRGASITVAGRVVTLARRKCLVADACAQIECTTREALDLLPGDWVVIRGVPSGRRLVDARLVQRFPAPEPRQGGEFARQSWQGVGPRLRVRSRVLSEIRGYFARHGFCEVDTPLVGPSPGFDTHVEGLRAEGGWLVTSPEQALKRLLVGGHPRIYQLSHAFRADEAGPWHESEFLLLEWYRAFADPGAVMRDTEQLVARVARAIRGRAELALPDGRRLDASPPYAELTVAEAFTRYADVADPERLATEDEARFFELLVSRVEPALAAFRRPVWLTGYPISQAALARAAPDNPQVADRFELYAGGIELSNGFGELTDPREHRRRYRRAASARQKLGRRPQPPDPRFIDAVVEGLPPCAGNALGVDRLVALVTGAASIGLVQPLDR
jgi:elongation factor P--(R)-beta-lysine ligase